MNLEKFPYNLLSPYIVEGYKIDESKEFEIENIDAIELICARRIDLMAKWLLIEAREQGLDLDSYIELYDAHIAAFSNGTYIEPGNMTKNSINKYLEVFENVRESIKKQGFDENNSLIPAGNNYEIVDGSHRVACAAYYNKKVKIIRFPHITRRFDSFFFKSRGLAEVYLDRMVSKFVELKEDVYCACIWPVANDEKLRKKSIEYISEVGELVYEKEIFLNKEGIKLFVRQVYMGQKWIGTFLNKYEGANYKAECCYSEKHSIRIVFFQCDDSKKVVDVKKRIRELFDIENHSVHITDNHSETISMSKIVLNKNSIRFLNYSKPDKYLQVNECISLYMSKIKENNYNIDDFIVDSSVVLSLFGGRKARDLDFLSLTENVKKLSEDIDNHESQLKYHVKSKKDLIYNQDNYFTYFDYKFITMENLVKMKQNRGEFKDKRDIDEINEILKGMDINNEC